MIHAIYIGMILIGMLMAYAKGRMDESEKRWGSFELLPFSDRIEDDIRHGR